MKCGPMKSLAARRRAKNLDLLLEQGADFDLEIVYKEDGNPVDLTGASVHCQFRERISDPKVLLDLTSAADGGLQISAGGKIVMKISAAKTGAITAAIGVWDMLVTFPNGGKIRLLKGKWEMDKGVTR